MTKYLTDLKELKSRCESELIEYIQRLEKENVLLKRKVRGHEIRYNVLLGYNKIPNDIEIRE